MVRLSANLAPNERGGSTMPRYSKVLIISVAVLIAGLLVATHPYWHIGEAQAIHRPLTGRAQATEFNSPWPQERAALQLRIDELEGEVDMLQDTVIDCDNDLQVINEYLDRHMRGRLLSPAESRKLNDLVPTI